MSHLSQLQLRELIKEQSFLISHTAKNRKTERDREHSINTNLFHKMNRFFKKMLRVLSPSIWRLYCKLPFNWKESGGKTNEAISYRSFFIGQKYARKEFKAFCLLITCQKELLGKVFCFARMKRNWAGTSPEPVIIGENLSWDLVSFVHW